MQVTAEEYRYLANAKVEEERAAYEHERWFLYNIYIMLPHGSNFIPPSSPKAFLPFKWDEPDGPKVISHVTETETMLLAEMFRDFVSNKPRN